MAGLPQIVDDVDVKCSQCREYYREPRLLDCLHYFCRECIQSLICQGQGSEDGQFHCPACRKATDVPRGEASNLQTPFFVIRKTKLYQDAIQAQSQGNVCDQCGEDASEPAEFYCAQCSEFVCKFCEQAHKRQRRYRDHVLVTTEEVRRNPGGSPFAAALPDEKFCKVHKKQQLRYYCCKCEVVMCTDCFVLQHQGHQCETIENCTPECKNILNHQLSTLMDDRKRISSAIQEAEQIKSQIENQAENAKEEIRVVFREVITVVQRHEEKLLTRIREEAGDKTKALDAQLENLGSAASDIGHVVSFIRECLVSGDDTEVMSLRQLMSERIQEQLKKSDVTLSPATEADIAVNVSKCPNEVTRVLQEHAFMSLPEADPSQCTAEGLGVELAVTNQSASFNVHVRCSKGQVCREPQSITVELKSKVDGSVVRGESEMQTPELYKITYTPKVRGRHELTVCIHDCPIEGSPFQVFVDYPPQLIREPVRKISGLIRPYGAVLSGESVLFVSESASTHTRGGVGATASLTAAGIAVVDTKEGKLVSRHEQQRLSNPAGIGIDGDGFRYVVDNTGKEDESIKKYDQSWNLVSLANLLSEFTRPGRIRIHDNQIFICDRGHDKIKVFDTDLRLVRTLSITFNRPVDIAFDKDGNIFVTQLYGHCLSKLDPTGERKLLEIGNTEPGVLKSPRGIAIHRDLVYVTQRDEAKISVFTTNGQFVTNFGSQAGLLDPASIVVDKDGFIYVCDEENGCILVF